MNDREARGEMTDAMLDQEIERALAVDPSPEFVARVRTRIASEPSRSAWRLRGMLLVAASVFVVLGAAAVIVNQSSVWRVGPGRSALDARVVSAAFGELVPERRSGSIESAIGKLSPSASKAPGQVAAASTIVRVAPREPEILFAADESAALKRLMRGLPGGVVEQPSPVANLRDSLDSSDPRDSSSLEVLQPITKIVVSPMSAIPPIAIEPLESAAR